MKTKAKHTQSTQPARHHINVLGQLLKLIPLLPASEWVEVDGKERLMVFISNNTAWSPRSVCDLYRARWDIEVFFKQVKQTLKLGDFLGYNANAIRWQAGLRRARRQ